MIEQSSPSLTPNMVTNETAVPQLSPNWLLAARVGWILLAIVVVTILITSLPGYGQTFAGRLAHISAQNPNNITVVFAILSGIASLGTALLSLGLAFLFYRRRFMEPMVALLSFYLLLYAIVMAGPLEKWGSYWFDNNDVAMGLQGFLITTPTIALFALFPNGRFVPTWSRWLLIFTIPFSVALFLLQIYNAIPFSEVDPQLLIGVAALLLLCFATGLYAQFYRFRHVSSSLERQQAKWVIYGFSLWLVYILLSSIPYYYLETLPADAPVPLWASISVLGWFVALSIVPLCLTFAVARYRLWDIDIIINRTILFGALTAIGVAIYMVVVGLAGVIFQQSSVLTNVILTAVSILILYRPVQLRLQQGVDKLYPVPEWDSDKELGRSKAGLGETAVTWHSWVALFLWGFAILIGIAGLAFLFLNWDTPKPDRWGFWGFQSLNGILVTTIGAFVAWNRRQNPVGWFLIMSGIFGAIVGLSEEVAVYTFLTQPGAIPNGEIIAGLGHWLWIPSYALLGIFIPLLFPSGHFLSRRWRWVGLFGLLWVAVASFWVLTFAGPLENMPFIDNPFGIEIETPTIFNTISPSLLILWPGLFLMSWASVSLVLRYRQSDLVVRQQLKWFAYAVVLMPFAGVVGQFNGFLPDLFLLLLVAVLPISIGIAILRYNLYDIDHLINRTLVYGALTAFVVIVYVLVVGSFGALFQTQGNWVVALIATGLIAVLFQPLRDRWQRWVNQLLYGRRDEPFEVLASLGQRLQDTMSPETVYPTIVETVAQTLKLPYAALAVKRGGQMETAVSYGNATKDEVVFPLAYQGEEIGQLIVSRRVGEDTFSQADERLLRNIARQTGTAVHALQLNNDLQRARQQIISSREEERRRLRRDLHDGLGPSLAAQMLKLGSARALLTEQPQLADQLLADMETDIENTLADVRRIVYDLRPPALDQLGLSGALRTYAETCSAGTEPPLTH